MKKSVAYALLFVFMAALMLWPKIAHIVANTVKMSSHEVVVKPELVQAVAPINSTRFTAKDGAALHQEVAQIRTDQDTRAKKNMKVLLEALRRNKEAIERLHN